MSFNTVDVLHFSIPSNAFSYLYRDRFARSSQNTHASVMAEAAGKVEGAAKTKESAQVQDTRKTKTTQQTVFHPFSRLPAELRAKIWAISLEDQIERVMDPLRIDSLFGVPSNAIIIHEHEKMDGGKRLMVRSKRGYPTLFFVNREARYEAAKVDGGAWYEWGTDAREVYVNLDKERVYLATCCNSIGWSTETHLRSKAHGTTDCIHPWHL
ncbi:unnamed protein product [Alternaria sp. RS040]